jgi:hypothetical protein
MNNESTMRIDKNGNKNWKKKNGLLHRLDGPAIEWANGHKEWYQNGKLHRLDGPAIEWANGTKEWYQDGKIHRLDGPARERKNGTKEWWQNGKRHRLDGPAVVFLEGIKQWWLNDILYKTKEEYFNALSDEAKTKCLFSEDFLNE